MKGIKLVSFNKISLTKKKWKENNYIIFKELFHMENSYILLQDVQFALITVESLVSSNRNYCNKMNVFQKSSIYFLAVSQ